MAKLVPGVNDLATTHPELAKEAHGWDPKTVTAGSQKKMEWKCLECSHQWGARIGNRTKSYKPTGCTSCGLKRRANTLRSMSLEKNGSLQEAWDRGKYLNLKDEWNYSRNEKEGVFPNKITVYNHIRAHWICSFCSHPWQVALSNRTGGNKSGCDKCRGNVSGQQIRIWAELTSIFNLEQCHLDYKPDIEGIHSLDIYISSKKIAIEYDGGNWHKSKETNSRDKQKSNSCKKNNIFLIRVRDSKLEKEESHDIITKSDKDVSLTEIQGIIEVIRENCSLTPKEMDLAEDYLEANHFRKDDLVVETQQNIRKHGRRAITIPFKDSLAYLFPELCEEWDYEKNTIGPECYTPGVNQEVFWRCRNNVGHKGFKESPNVRTTKFIKKGHAIRLRACKECPPMVQPEESLARLHPQISEIWDYERNKPFKPEDFAAKSSWSAWWVCKDGTHSWSAIISNRTLKDSGCGVCKNRRTKRDPKWTQGVRKSKKEPPLIFNESRVSL